MEKSECKEEFMKKLQALDPTVKPIKEPMTFTPRPHSLRNVRIGLVDNTKYNSDKLLVKVATLLEQEHGAQSHILRRKNKASVPVHEAIISEFKAGCDVVIAGIGD
jgi:hypothetical protein